MARKGKIICGVDEVGRGPLAGPVLSAAVVIPSSAPKEFISSLKDSKQLTPARRSALSLKILSICLVGFGAASAKEIDQLNILQATMLSMVRAVAALQINVHHALVDGNQIPDLPCPATAIVAGDETEPAISAASIVAKVLRDSLMGRLSVRYPGYGWENNAGYGTAQHLLSVQQLGLTRHHRRSFTTRFSHLHQERPYG
jgi:ribonuclease HII